MPLAIHEPENFPRDNEFWHFPRKKLAAQKLAQLIGGPTRALTLFAPRRTGKSEFLRRDFGPHAHGEGHRVIYIDFMQSPDLLAMLLHTLKASLKTSRKRNWSWDLARTALANLPQSITLRGVTINLQSLQDKPPPEVHLYLAELLGKVANRRKPTILLFDEVQELCKDRGQQSLIAALRSSLDKHGDGLATIFTGSSLEGLQAMFSERQAPFFHFAANMDLPRLDNDFVKHIVKLFNKRQNRQINVQSAIRVFGKLEKNPHLFCAFITYLMGTPAGIYKALEAFINQKAEQSRFQPLWLSMSPIQRAVASALVQGFDKIYSKEARRKIGEWMDKDAPQNHHVQSALQALNRAGIAYKWRNKWFLDNPEFAAWIRKANPPISR